MLIHNLIIRAYNIDKILDRHQRVLEADDCRFASMTLCVDGITPPEGLEKGGKASQDCEWTIKQRLWDNLMSMVDGSVNVE